MAPSIILDPGSVAALLSGRKIQLRLGADTPLAQCRPGDGIRVREACVAIRQEGGQDYATSLNRAAFVIFPDGWRQYPDGSGWQGKRPDDSDRKWVAPMQMPLWATRATLIVDWMRTERLRQITRADIRAEGALPLLGGLLWRWPRPIPGRYLSARRAFAAYWDINHSTPGERWADDPHVLVLGFHLLAQQETP